MHRSHIVNLDHVERMTGIEDGRLEIILVDGSSVIASRSGSRKLKAMIS